MASNFQDNVIRGRGGDDQIDVFGPGTHTIIFEPTLALNGEDEITGFSVEGPLPDRIGIAFNDDFTQSDLRGSGEFFQVLEFGVDAIGDDVGLLVFTNEINEEDTALIADIIAAINLAPDESVFVLAGGADNASLVRLFRDGADDPEDEDLASFEGVSNFDLADFSSLNILGFNEYNP